ncbi:TPM domain-containing protein [Shimia abyssi]|uniref:TLP18.3/Psb32/MOLO-1 phosphatase superfamily protein n=1 Tax=Shimia abyssi TaxID=1662395 RepID=A0A2P8F8I4_9RHOB|nr:TPM domain-containing protein [Shimia abyssi]PSL17972.1 TLP18.3/Psb32/MOLO-1 phosphatase superfamily protein [Shimia abyssi]
MRIFLTHLKAVFLALSKSLNAQPCPDYTEIFVNDFADLLSVSEESDIRAKLRELRNETAIEFTVVTINQMSDYGHYGEIEPFSTGLFNTWGIGDATRNNGVLMLVARYDRKIRIEVGSGYGRSKDASMKSIIDNDILPNFREDNYADGIAEGVSAVIFDLTGSRPGEYGMSGFEKAIATVKRVINNMGEWIFLFLAPFLAIPVKLYRRWQRNKLRN